MSISRTAPAMSGAGATAGVVSWRRRRASPARSPSSIGEPPPERTDCLSQYRLNEMIVVTVYEPDLAAWQPGFRRRRTQ